MRAGVAVTTGVVNYTDKNPLHNTEISPRGWRITVFDVTLVDHAVPEPFVDIAVTLRDEETRGGNASCGLRTRHNTTALENPFMSCAPSTYQAVVENFAWSPRDLVVYYAHA